MSLISVQARADHLRVDAPGMEACIIPFQPVTGRHSPVVVWGDGVEALDVIHANAGELQVDDVINILSTI